MTGFVYAIGDGEGRVKIGWSADPLRRLNKINSDCPQAAILLGVIEATKKQEAEIHSLLNRWRLTGEWFCLEGAVTAFVSALPKPRPRPARTAHPRPGNSLSLCAWLTENATQSQFAKQVGCSQSHLCLILKGERGPSLKLAKRIMTATEGAVPMEALVREASE